MSDQGEDRLPTRPLTLPALGCSIFIHAMVLAVTADSAPPWAVKIYVGGFIAEVAHDTLFGIRPVHTMLSLLCAAPKTVGMLICIGAWLLD